MKIALVVLTLSPLWAFAQLYCPGGETHLTRDTKGTIAVTASHCRDVEVQAHFLGSRGAYRTALAFENPLFPLDSGCAVNKSCLKYTQECRATKWVQGLYRGACKGDALADPSEISCTCQAPDYVNFKARIQPGQTTELKPAFLVDSTGDDVIDSRMTDDLQTGGRNFRVYQLFRTLSRWDLEDLNAGPAGDFNDYLAAIETRDCDPNVIFPPHTTDFGGPENPIDCVNACGKNPCEAGLVAAQQPLRFSVALGIDDVKAEADRERRGRKMHLTVAMHTDYNAEQLAVCPVLWLDWRRPRDPMEVDDLTQFINYGADSACASNQGLSAGSLPMCPPNDRTIVEAALPISLSVQGVTPSCNQNQAWDESMFAFLNSKGRCGARTVVRDYELPMKDIDNGLVDSSLHYAGASTSELVQGVVRVDLFVFRQLDTRLRTHPFPVNGPFVCPSGINALLRGAPASVAQVTRYPFTPPGRPRPTPGFTVYVRQ